MDSKDLNFKLNYYLELKEFASKVKSSDAYVYEQGVYKYKINNVYPLNNLYNPEIAFVPVVNFLMALELINQYYDSRNEVLLSESKLLIENSIKHAHVDKDKMYFRHEYYQPLYLLNKGWVSGMAQGLFISACVRLYLITQDEVFFQYAKSAFDVMIMPVEQGGCMLTLEEGVWFEEYPSKKNNSFVLNGNIFSVFALNDFNQIYDCQELLYQSIRKLSSTIAEFYVFEGCCRYDLNNAICDENYLKLHHDQLDVLINDFGLKDLEPFINITTSCAPTCNNLTYSFKFDRVIRRVHKLIFILLIVVKKLAVKK
ncbi:D-glucuronyl C5-epimerase [Idiomarina sp. A28L]|uniref:D-glucuronyl C5-epimerase n=1 Tax=Idiomarina sp. A28L TaxID=1036674 RepID=UPI0002138C4A|nr:D-glucuronyl C5-epimerase [Idiomarina sp. A28L]EGN74607.1 D-glucuronyl C5-epimerase [Idiomarina sp. A28L]